MIRLLTIVVFVTLLSGCFREPKSRALADVALRHGSVLDELHRLTSNRDRVVVITAKEITLRDGTVYQLASPEAGRLAEDWKAVAQFVETIGAEHVSLRADPQAVEIVVYAYGLVSGGYVKGLVWKSDRPDCVEDVDHLIGKTGRGWFYSPTQKAGWYVFLRVDG